MAGKVPYCVVRESTRSADSDERSSKDHESRNFREDDNGEWTSRIVKGRSKSMDGWIEKNCPQSIQSLVRFLYGRPTSMFYR